MLRVGVVTEDSTLCEAIRAAAPEDVRVEWFAGRREIAETDGRKVPSVLFMDLALLGPPPATERGRTARAPWQDAGLDPSTRVVVLAPRDQASQAIRMVRAGALTYLTYPFRPTELKNAWSVARAALRSEGEAVSARDGFWKDIYRHLVRTNSAQMQTVMDQLKAVAPTDATILLYGETGTGKNMLAKVIHEHSARAHKPFVAVHCGAIPEGLVESEFFGHEKGAFTGAVRKKLGKFEIADQGTIFLDEIGTITLPVQIKLLQVLQEGTFSRVGGEKELHTDVRVISATNVDLKSLVEQGRFRQDLYYRLEVFPIHIPPLRERREDIPLLADIFLEKLRRRHRKPIQDIHPDVIGAFLAYDWPGNIREMENVMERAFILETETTLTPTHFPAEIMGEVRAVVRPLFHPAMTLAEFRKHAVEEAERTYLSELLRYHKGRINLTAQSAGITPRQLHKLMKRHNLRKEDYRPARKAGD